MLKAWLERRRERKQKLADEKAAQACMPTAKERALEVLREREKAFAADALRRDMLEAEARAASRNQRYERARNPVNDVTQYPVPNPMQDMQHSFWCTCLVCQMTRGAGIQSLASDPEPARAPDPEPARHEAAHTFVHHSPPAYEPPQQSSYDSGSSGSSSSDTCSYDSGSSSSDSGGGSSD